MPSENRTVDRPAVTAVVGRYHRLERSLSAGVALLVAGTAAAALLALPLAVGLLAAAGVVALVRLPLFRTGGTARLVTEADTGAVTAAFAGPTPPPLVLQWGVADDVRPTENGATYEFAYLFGLRTVRMDVTASRSATPTDGTVELTVTVDGTPWGSYRVSVSECDRGSTVDVEWTSDRRFGLRRLPQLVVAERYRADALATQGYDTVERDVSLSL